MSLRDKMLAVMAEVNGELAERQELIESIRAREQKAEETEHPAEGLPAMGGSLDEDKLFGGLTGTVQARYDALPKVAQRALIGQAAKVAQRALIGQPAK